MVDHRHGTLWRSPLGKKQTLSFLLSIAIVLGLSGVLFHYLSGRAAYMHVGVMLGTLMTGIIWMVVMPSQRELVDATREHRKQNLAKGYQAKNVMRQMMIARLGLRP